MAIVAAARPMRRAVKCRERSLRHAETWDGITDEEILERDGWRCQVPGCKRRPIRRDLKYPHRRSKSIDHVVPLSLGGGDTAVNKRAAHLGCNMARGNRMGDQQLALFGSLREPPLMTEIAGTVRQRRPKRSLPPKRRCLCGGVLAGKGDRCRNCLISLAKQAAAMRADGYLWREICVAVGYANTGALFGLVKKYAGPALPTQKAARAA